MAKEVYGFKIRDNDYQHDPKDKLKYMLYINIKNLLIPIKKEFQQGWSNALFEFNDMLEILKYNKIQEFITYDPTEDTICKHPYELNTKDEIQECESDGEWNRFPHEMIIPSDEEVKILKDYNINLKQLSNLETSKLEKTLKYHEMF
ncbi:MAG: hypothetical protein PF542_03985 [Nanoarchaeota archaeon]|jgi:hypothetical protein|nr:hypothetical protein [Nanoarchaeota archaeon]